eukprot:11092320-Ditylum_brightwellii.AAC.1
MKIILTNIPCYEDMTSSMMISNVRVRYMDILEKVRVAMDTNPKYQMIPHDKNETASILGEVSLLCDSLTMHQLLHKK